MQTLPCELNTEDSGAELTFNKRNRVRSGIKWDDIAQLNPTLRIVETQKTKIFPKPDFAGLIAAGMIDTAAHIVKQVYDSLSPRPTIYDRAFTDADLQLYITGINRVMDGILKWANSKENVNEWIQESNRKPFWNAMPSKSFSLLTHIYGFEWRDHEDEIRIIGGNRVMRALQPGDDALERSVMDISLGWPSKCEKWKKKGFVIVETEKAVKIDSTNQFLFWVCINGHYNTNYTTREKAEQFKASLKPWLFVSKGTEIKGQFDTKEAALEFARTFAKRNGKKTVSEKGISVEAAERIGPEYRTGNISSDTLRDTFGFKGVNFGNWLKGDVNKAERQLHLNNAFDSFMDLANVMDLPPKAISLNGMVGVAIGAQGNGGKHAAHFVPGMNEINLTRTSGAGYLAHEWGHALDHYFARRAGLDTFPQPYFSEYASGTKYRFCTINGKVEQVKIFAADIRPEIVTRFKDVMAAINERTLTPEEMQSKDYLQHTPSKFTQAAYRLDREKGGKRYWDTDLEKFARCFDAFVTDKLQAAGQKNSYLSNFGCDDETVPHDEERKAICEAFQDLFNEVRVEAADNERSFLI